MQTVRDITASLALRAGRESVSGSRFEADMILFAQRGLLAALTHPWSFLRFDSVVEPRASRPVTLGTGITGGAFSFTHGGNLTSADDGSWIWDASGHRSRVAWSSNTTTYLTTAWPVLPTATTAITVVPGWAAVVEGGAVTGARRHSDGVALRPATSTVDLMSPRGGIATPVPSGQAIDYLSGPQDVPSAPRAPLGVSVASASSQGVRTLDVCMAYRWGAQGPIGPLSSSTSYSLTNVQTLTFTAPSLPVGSGGPQLYRVFYWRAPTLGYTDWRKVEDNSNSQCPPNGGVTISPDLSLATLEGDGANTQSERWQPTHLLRVYPPPDSVVPLLLTVEERHSQDRWEPHEPVPGGHQVADLALLYALSELYSAMGQPAEAATVRQRAAEQAKIALGTSRPAAADQPVTMGRRSLW